MVEGELQQGGYDENDSNSPSKQLNPSKLRKEVTGSGAPVKAGTSGSQYWSPFFFISLLGDYHDMQDT